MSELLKAVLVDGGTGEVIERELTTQELADLQDLQSQAAEAQAEQDAKAAARTSALAKLADLGLTAEEIAAL